jgi:proline iminopeptidase
VARNFIGPGNREHYGRLRSERPLDGGKTYRANPVETVAPTMTIERMLADTEEMILWARAEFGKERIILLGHSWGSILGLRMAERHPDWLHAYVGVGQGVDVRESERRGWRWTMDQAVAANNHAAIQDLQSIAPYAEGEGEIPLVDIFLQRRWLNAFGGAAYRRPDASFEGAAAVLAPEYSAEDFQRWSEAQTFSVEHLLPAVLNTDLSEVVRLETPLFLFLGRHDINVSSAVAAEWFETVNAPSKRLIWFEHSAHEVIAEEPGRMFDALVRLVRPIAVRAGDASPNSGFDISSVSQGGTTE